MTTKQQVIKKSETQILSQSINVKSEKHSKNIAIYEKATKMDPVFWDAWINIGIYYAKKGNYYKSIDNDKNSNEYYETWNNTGLFYYNRGEYNLALDCFKKVIDINLDLNTFRNIKKVSATIYNEQKAMEKLTNPDAYLIEKIFAVEELICLNRFNEIEPIFDSLFSEIERLKFQKEIKELYSYFMFETILRLNNESEEPEPKISARYFLKIALLLDNRTKKIKERILEFLINYIKNTDKDKFNKKGLRKIFLDWENDIILPKEILCVMELIKATSPSEQYSEILINEITKTLS